MARGCVCVCRCDVGNRSGDGSRVGQARSAAGAPGSEREGRRGDEGSYSVGVAGRGDRRDAARS